MGRRSCRLGIALLAVAVAAFLVVFLVARSPRWPDDAIFVPRDVATLQQAVDRASPGATIVLQEGGEAFRGPVTIDTANVVITSARGRARLEASGGEPALTIRGDGVVVRGLEIASESIGIRVGGSRCSIEGVRVLGAPIGIQLVNARECELSDIELHGGRVGLELVSSGGNTLVGVVVEGASEIGLKALGSWGNVIERASVFDASIGVSLEEESAENELRGCRVERAAVAGVEIHASNDNLLAGCTIRDSRIGVVLEGVTGNEILECEIGEVVVAGLLLQQAIQNRMTENTIRASEDAGILLSQSAENALSYNRIEGCAGAGIRLDGSDRNLVVGCRLEGNVLGIDSDRSSDSRILRNTIASTDRTGTGLSFAGGAENRILDNLVYRGELGIVLVESEKNTLLRNRIEEQKAAGLCLLSGSHANSVAENRITGSLVGIVMADSSRSEVLNNKVTGNDAGLLLVRSGPGARIEGNAIEANRIGIRQTDAIDIAGVGPSLDQGGEVAPSVVVNNVFARNEFLDVSNETSLPFYASGNWWGGVTGERETSLAVVSDGVYLEGSAWRGTLAIGTEADVSQEILGRILQYALIETGFRVIDLIGIGDSDRVREALRARDVDFIWWGTSETILPEEGDSEGEISTAPIPATRHWTAVVPEGTAHRLAGTTLSAFAAFMRESGEAFRYAATRGFGETASASFEKLYGLEESVASVSRAGTLGEAETLLKFGAVEMAIVDNLEETLTFSGYVALEDDLGAFEPVRILIASRRNLLTRFPEIEDVLTSLTDSLTTSTIHDLVSRVRLLQRQPDEVAREYLVQQGLLAE